MQSVARKIALEIATIAGKRHPCFLETIKAHPVSRLRLVMQPKESPSLFPYAHSHCHKFTLLTFHMVHVLHKTTGFTSKKEEDGLRRSKTRWSVKHISLCLGQTLSIRQICKVRNAASLYAQASVTQSVVIRPDYKQWNLLIQLMTGSEI